MHPDVCPILLAYCHPKLNNDGIYEEQFIPAKTDQIFLWNFNEAGLYS